MRCPQRKTFVITFLVILFFLFAALVCGKALDFSRWTGSRPVSSALDITDIDWEERYPYLTAPAPAAAAENPASPEARRSLIGRYTDKAKEWGSIGYTLASAMPAYDWLSKAGYVISSRLSDPAEGDSYVLVGDGYWVHLAPDRIGEAEAERVAVPYGELRQYLEDRGIAFLYCYGPSKERAEDSGLPAGAVSFTNRNIDTYIRALRAAGVDVLDFREDIRREGLDHYSLFYRTDHHWTVPAALWAVSRTEEELNARFGLGIRNADEFGPYRSKVYEKEMLGSYGTAVTEYVAEREDFELLIPEGETGFRLEIPDAGIDRTGSFAELFDNVEGFREDIENGKISMYSSILYGNRPFVRITNLRNPEGPRLLVIKDSFGIAAAPYLALSCSEIILLDTRPAQGNFSGSVIACIEDFAPDAVLAIQYAPQPLVLAKEQ